MATYIISYRKSDQSREVALMHLLQVLKKSGQKVFLIEQDSSPTIDESKLGVEYKFLQNDGLFDKAWSYNVAINSCPQEDRFIFGDADIFVDCHHLNNCIDLLDKFDCIDPKGQVFDLNENLTQLFYTDKKSVLRSSELEQIRTHVPFCGGLVLFTRKGLEQIHYWTESCRGWGAEDDIQSFKVKKLLSHYRKPYPVFHMHHQSLKAENPLYAQNNEVLEYYRKNINSLDDIVNYEPTIADEQKYRNF